MVVLYWKQKFWTKHLIFTIDITQPKNNIMNKQQPKTNTSLDKYPGSEMTVKSINEMGSKMEKIIFDGLPKTKLFSDAEIVMLQFVGAMICGSLRDPEAIKNHISYFCRDLVGYANTWMKLYEQNKPKIIKTTEPTKKP